MRCNCTGPVCSTKNCCPCYNSLLVHCSSKCNCRCSYKKVNNPSFLRKLLSKIQKKNTKIYDVQ